MEELNLNEAKKLNKFRLVLSSKGKEIYKGGNIEVMKPLIKEYSSLREIQDIFLKVGTSQQIFYICEGFKDKWRKILFFP